MRKFAVSILFILVACSSNITKNNSAQNENFKNTNWPHLKGANVVPPISKEDLNFLINDWHVNAIRVLHLTPLSDASPFNINQDALAQIYETINEGLKNNIVVIFSPGVSMENHDKFFSNEEYKKAFLNLWLTIAQKYKNNPGNFVYDLMNEPHDKLASTQWQNYAELLVKEVRKIDPIHTIMIEPAEWG